MQVLLDKDDTLQLIPEGYIMFPFMGPLMGGSKCHILIFRNGIFPCHLFLRFHVDLKVGKCRLSNLRKCPCNVGNVRVAPFDKLHVACRFLKIVLSPCRI